MQQNSWQWRPGNNVGGGHQAASPSQSVQGYQLAVSEAKVRLDLAAAPGAWLMHRENCCLQQIQAGNLP